MKKTFLALLMIVLGAKLCVAETVSGPIEGTELKELKVHVTNGDDAGKLKNIATDSAKGTTIYVFVQADLFTRPIARFIRALDTKLASDHDKVKLVTVWLTDDIDKSKDYLPIAQNSLKLQQATWTVWDGDKNGPGEWGINSDAHVTVVVSKEGKATKSLGYQSINETVVPAVLNNLEK